MPQSEPVARARKVKPAPIGEEAQEVFDKLDQGFVRLKMALNRSASSLATGPPGPVTRDEMSKILRDLEAQIGGIHNALTKVINK